MKKKLLIIDDEPIFCEALATGLAKTLPATEIFTVYSVSALEACIESNPPDCIVMDLCLDSKIGVESGYKVLVSLTRVLPQVRVIVLTSNGDEEYGIKCMELGAANFVEKPASYSHLTALIIDAFKQKELREKLSSRTISNKDWVSYELVGKCQAIEMLRQQLLFASFSNAPVLFWGEEGVGKKFTCKILNRLRGGSEIDILKIELGKLNQQNIIMDFINIIHNSFSSIVESVKVFHVYQVEKLPPNILNEIFAYVSDLYKVTKNMKEKLSFYFFYTISLDVVKNTNHNLGYSNVDIFSHFSGISFTGVEIKVPNLKQRFSDFSRIVFALIENISQYSTGFRKNNIALTTEIIRKLEMLEYPKNYHSLMLELNHIMNNSDVILA